MVRRLHKQHTIVKLCQALEVSRSGYYAYLAQKTGKRIQQETAIRRAILSSHIAAPSYGVDNIHADVRAQMVCGRNRIRRLMRQMGICSCRKRTYRMTTTNSQHEYAVAPNLIKGLEVTHPNQVWVGDITYIPTHEGYLYLAIVKDKFTREIVGYSYGDQITSLLVQQALLMALGKRKPPPGLLHHSDRGVQYCCHDFRRLLRAHDLTASMSRKGNPYDNAHAENFFSCLKSERLSLQQFNSRRQAGLAAFEYIEGFYNTRRRHSALGRIPPAQFYRNFVATHGVGLSGVSESTRLADTRRKVDKVSMDNHRILTRY